VSRKPEQIRELVASFRLSLRLGAAGCQIDPDRRNPVPDAGYVLIFSDITERKRSEQKFAARDAAEEASRTIALYPRSRNAPKPTGPGGKMASARPTNASIAHEIKNPLNFVNNFAALSVDLLGN
jgi:hypothetical protein